MHSFLRGDKLSQLSIISWNLIKSKFLLLNLITKFSKGLSSVFMKLDKLVHLSLYLNKSKTISFTWLFLNLNPLSLFLRNHIIALFFNLKIKVLMFLTALNLIQQC